MCGIVGVVDQRARPAIDGHLLQQMTRQLVHRGPDDEGYFLADGIGLGHRRLSIVDLAGGHQPMGNEDGSIQVVFNGEIYNYAALREDVIARGHRLATRSDTEVLVHLYEEEGPAFVQRLRGMFALALWDGPRRRLVIARDRLGKKPLYYWQGAGQLLVASEIKALLVHPDVPRETNEQGLHYFLRFGYAPSPMTMFREIVQLPPACYGVYEDGALTITRYWALGFEPRRTCTVDEAQEQLDALLLDAVRLRLMSEVPLGVLLSGGIDSSAVVAYMRRLISGRIQTFSIGFDEADYNELAYARLVAERFGTDHHEFIVEPRAIDVLPKLIWHYDQPCGDSSALATYYLAQLTRQHVTVALNGDGGDEVFAGYTRYWATQLSQQLAWIPPAALHAGESMLHALASRAREGGAERWRRPMHFLQALARYPDPIQRYARWVSVFTDDQQAALYTPAFAARLRGDDPAAWLGQRIRGSGAPTLVERLMHGDLLTYLPEDLLKKMDVTTMAHSLEARSPLLDHVLIEWSATIPLQMKLRGMTTKYLIRRLIRREMPAPIMRRKKMGFGVPIGRWFRGEWRQAIRDILLDPQTIRRGYFQERAVRELIDSHDAGQQDARFQLWALLNVELWHRQFIDAAAPVQV